MKKIKITVWKNKETGAVIYPLRERVVGSGYDSWIEFPRGYINKAGNERFDDDFLDANGYKRVEIKV